MPDQTHTEQKPKVNNLQFIKAIARYFMEFLETDFHKRKNPRRSIKLRSGDNLLIGINLAKYPSFNKKVWKLINEGFDKKILEKIVKGEYKSNIPKNLQELIKSQIQNIKKETIEEIIQNIERDIKRISSAYKDNFNKAVSMLTEASEQVIKNKIVVPFVKNIESSLVNANLADENTIFLMEEELTSVLLNPFQEKITDILNQSLNNESNDIKKILKQTFELKELKESITTFFEGYQVQDLFNELFELERNKNILDKQDFYLYFFDITDDKNRKYPVFYITFSAEREKDTINLEFDSRVYINKKVLDYIAQEYNTVTGKKGSIRGIDERIIYLPNVKEGFHVLLNSVITELHNFFSLDKKIAISDPENQSAKSLFTKLSNTCYIALFDKSDESLINDYEEIINLEDENILVQAFDKLVDDFINKNPEPFNQKVDDEWDETDTSDKLVFKSPIPLNSEQLKILSALKKNNCKYVVAEGPPGTGKSHTITAIIFNAILENQSVLVLSDKKEALDVVEDKIVTTMNKVRVEQDFQNPILRLGKTGSTYSQILSGTSINKINEHYRVIKNEYENLMEKIQKRMNSLKEELSAEIISWGEVNINEIAKLCVLEHYFKENSLPIDLNELLSSKTDIEDFEKLRNSLKKIKELVKEETIDFNPSSSIDENKLAALKGCIKLLQEISPINSELAKQDARRWRFLDILVNKRTGLSFDLINNYFSCHKNLTSTIGEAITYLNSLDLKQKIDVNDLDSIYSLNKFLIESNKILEKVKKVYNRKVDKLSLLGQISSHDIEKLELFINKYSELDNFIFGFLFRGKEIEKLDIEVKKAFPNIQLELPHKRYKALRDVLEIYKYLVTLGSDMRNKLSDRYDVIQTISFLINSGELSKISQSIADLEGFDKVNETLINEGWITNFELKHLNDLNYLKYLGEYILLCNKLNDSYNKISSLLPSQAKLELGKNIYKDISTLDFTSHIKVFESLGTLLAKTLQMKQSMSFVIKYMPYYPNTMRCCNISMDSFNSLVDNKLLQIDDEEFNKYLRFVDLKQSVQDKFNNTQISDYLVNKGIIEELVTTEMAYILDSRVVNFWENNKNDALTIRSIIRNRTKFDKNDFHKLKNAFPCILAGIRDYAEYIPLEPELFDLVIIDEASQVSIAQAFPALLRAKKVLVLGDNKQFSNVKSAHARSDINKEHVNDLANIFKRYVSSEPAKLEKLKKFNIKTSILDFFEFIANYRAQLMKHFRGYKELISYSNKYFYNNNLQVMKIRGKRIDEVLKFELIAHDGKQELKANTNFPEVEYIISQLQALKDKEATASVGIITPHTNQQKLLYEKINQLPIRDYCFENLKLKIMTFDTCQGEERDIIFYSMVATKEDDKLNHIFIRDLSNVDLDDEGKIKAQRLNVGFSRSKECMHFVLSKPLEMYSGAIGDAIRHYFNILKDAEKEKDISTVDQRSYMEKEVLNWFYQTRFWNKYKDSIELKPQFKLGEYLKQLDKTYNHPFYEVDFLLLYRDPQKEEHKIIIEYDGFYEHFKNYEEVTKYNYQDYYKDADVYRQKVLQGYGYKFLKINKFNLGDNPIETLDSRIQDLVKKKPINPR